MSATEQGLNLALRDARRRQQSEAALRRSVEALQNAAVPPPRIIYPVGSAGWQNQRAIARSLRAIRPTQRGARTAQRPGLRGGRPLHPSAGQGEMENFSSAQGKTGTEGTQATKGGDK